VALGSWRRPRPLKQKYSADDISPVLEAIARTAPRLILIGGQAINYWSDKYQQDTPEWRRLRPYTSEDLDFYGGRAEALSCSKIIPGTKATLNDGHDPSPNAGVLFCPFKGGKLRIDILTTVYGLKTKDVVRAAPLIQKGDISIQVLHPLHCLIGKTISLANLPQEERQDEKHLKLALLFVSAFLRDLVAQGEVRSVLNMIEEIYRVAGTSEAVSVFDRHALAIESSIPWEDFKSSQQPAIRALVQKRLPQLTKILFQKRDAFKKK
jgi:hypothetical protein